MRGMGKYFGDSQSARAIVTAVGFIPRIESMRGIAALTVSFQHAVFPLIDGPGRAETGADRTAMLLLKAFTNGYGAVVAFFVISGFVLARSIDRNFDFGHFAKNRALRLLPASIVSVGIFAALYFFFGFKLFPGASYTPTNVVLNMLMLRADIDHVMWSLKSELAASPLIFFCVWLARRHGPHPLLGIALVLFGLSFIGQYTHALGEDTSLGPWFAFPMGVYLHFNGSSVFRIFSSRATAIVAFLSVVIFCSCAYFNNVASPALFVECATSATLIGLIAFNNCAMFSVLDWPVVRFFGKISYSFYLLHPLCLWSWWASGASQSMIGFGAPISLVCLIAAISSIGMAAPVAYLSWRFVELPALRLKSRKRAHVALPATSGPVDDSSAQTVGA
jgi:peptidoglycan/LPS O-acetylase OafA/YrhL